MDEMTFALATFVYSILKTTRQGCVRRRLQIFDLKFFGFARRNLQISDLEHSGFPIGKTDLLELKIRASHLFVDCVGGQAMGFGVTDAQAPDR